MNQMPSRGKRMSIKHQFHSSELETMRGWYGHAQIWGYECSTGEETNFESAAHGITDYYYLTALSDIIFRNVVRLRQRGTVFGYDLWGKAGQVKRTLENLKSVCDNDGEVVELLDEYFEKSDPAFADEIEGLKITPDTSAPFEVVVRAAKALYGIVYKPDAFVRKQCKEIVASRKWYDEGGKEQLDAEDDSD